MQEASQLVYNNSIDSANFNSANKFISIPYYSVYSDRIVIHPRPFEPILKRKVSEKSLSNLKKDKFKGSLSPLQIGVIKKRLTCWLNSIIITNKYKVNKYQRSEHYPVFMTLTLSSEQVHTDQEIKRSLLDLFIKKIKKKYNVTHYFWRAEKQENNNIHFHLIIDKYISYYELLEIWNQTQENLGYITEFEKKHNHRKPNSVDVRSAKDVKHFINYVIKYATKIEGNNKVSGRIFGFSDNLRTLGVYQSELDSNISDQLVTYTKNNYFKIYKSDYFTVIYFDRSFYGTSLYNQLELNSVKYYRKMYNYIYEKENQTEKPINKMKLKSVENYCQLSMFSLSEQIKINSTFDYINSKDEKKYRVI